MDFKLGHYLGTVCIDFERIFSYITSHPVQVSFYIIGTTCTAIVVWAFATHNKPER